MRTLARKRPAQGRKIASDTPATEQTRRPIDPVAAVEGARPSQLFVETMSAGALVVTSRATMSWVNPQMAALLRTTPKSLLGKPAETLIAEASLAGFKDLLRTGQRNRGPVGLTFVAADGTEVPAVVTAAKATLEGGVLTCLLVTGPTATTASAPNETRHERWFHTLLQNSSDVIAVVDRYGRPIYVNPAHERMGLPAANWGASFLDLVHPEDSERVRAMFAEHVSRPGRHAPGVFRVRTRSGGWRVLEVVATNCLDDPAIGGMVLNARDVTERAYLTRALRTLGQGNQVLVHARDESSLLADTCRAIVEVGGYRLAWVGYIGHDAERSVRVVASAGHTEYLEGLRITWGADATGKGPTGSAIRTGKVRVMADVRRSKTFAPWRERAELSGLRSSCVMPLRVGGTVIGTLQIYAAEPGAFDPGAVRLLRDLADDLGYGIGRIRDRAALEASEERFRVLADGAPVGILETRPAGGIRYANARLAEICGRSVESLMGTGWTDAVHPDDVMDLLARIEHLRPTRQAVTFMFRILRPDGGIRHVRLSAAPRDEGGPDNGYIGTVEDISEEVEAQQALAHQAFYDDVTGLPNRALFLDRLNQELVQARREGPHIAVLFLDLDRFKIVNDSLGHERGDAVLKDLGARFAQAVRTGETAARFSGDEFIFIIRDVHDVGDAVAAANRLLKVLEPPVRCAGQNLTMTGSVGIVMPKRRAEATSVLRDADTAMYQAKAEGGNSYALFDKDLHRRSVRRLAMEGDLRQALARSEFELYYQPGVNPATGELRGAEALIRWHHPKRGLVPPLDFIPVAEDSGLIKPIGNWVFEQALAQLASWDQDGPRLSVLSVNVSTRQLDDKETASTLREIIERHGVDPRRVSLEVTESAVMAASEGTRWSLDRFRELGLRLAIDDFGTGYSSLAYLHALPVTSVKIDRSFIERLQGPDDSTPVVKAIIELAHAMGLIVVAEGIEAGDEHRRALVAEMGCDVAQGFYWTPALPPAELARWCAGRRPDTAWPPPRRGR